jgi:hypothetical protein
VLTDRSAIPRRHAGFALLAVLLMSAPASWAQGISVGKREFAVTRAVEDPLVADELQWPSLRYIKRRAGQLDEPARVMEVAGEFSKTVTPNFGVALGGSWLHLEPDQGSSITGFANLDIRLKYAFFESVAHEAIVSAGLAWEIGGTGRRAVGADPFDVVTPALFFGKGFGDLPDRVAWLRPLAATGELGARLPTRATTKAVRTEGSLVHVDVQRNPNSLLWGVVLEYSLSYLQAFVRDVGLGAPVKELIPVVEIAAETALDRGAAGKTNGTINPGIIWQGDKIQIGLQAVIPMNDRTGNNVGVQASLTLFLDELFPNSLGRPLFGR